MNKERLVNLLMEVETDADIAGFSNCFVCRPKADFVADYLLANGVIVPPVKFGSEIFVTPDRGKHFHKARLYGCDEKGVWLVWVNDNLLTEEDKHIVANPMKHTFYDWFINIYTREEAEAKLIEGRESE